MPDATKTSFFFTDSWNRLGTAAITSMPAQQSSASGLYQPTPVFSLSDIGVIDEVTGIRLSVTARKTAGGAANPTLNARLGQWNSGGPSLSPASLSKSASITTTSDAAYALGSLTDNWGITGGDFFTMMASANHVLALEIWGSNPDTFANQGINLTMTELLVRFTQRGQPGMLAFSL